MTEKRPGQNHLDEDERIASLQERIDKAQRDEIVRTGKDKQQGADQNYRLGSRVLADLIAGIGGGALFGWIFDRWFGTTPWLLLGFLFLGIFVAFRNIWKISNGSSDDKES